MSTFFLARGFVILTLSVLFMYATHPAVTNTAGIMLVTCLVEPCPSHFSTLPDSSMSDATDKGLTIIQTDAEIDRQQKSQKICITKVNP